MNRSSTHFETQAAAGEDYSVCHEWQGMSRQSYDSLDSLLLEFAHGGTTHSPEHHTAGAVELTIMGQSDEPLPLNHYFL